MKDYIRNRLEENNWLTPKDVEQVIKKDTTLTLDKMLSLSQITDIIKSWREETNTTKDLYVENYPLNANNLAFLRGITTLHDQKNEIPRVYKFII